MRRGFLALVGFGLGAAAMYFVDPVAGRRRRVRLGEAAQHAARRARATADVTARDVRHRARGAAARAAGRFAGEPPPSDEVLMARVRTRLGRLVAHPGAIHVSAADGVVTLTGPIFQAEMEQVLRGVAAVHGVTAVDNRMQAYSQAGHVPALQGPGPKRTGAFPVRWNQWTPTARLITGAAGLGLVMLSSGRRSLRGAAAGLAGAELLDRALAGRGRA